MMLLFLLPWIPFPFVCTSDNPLNLKDGSNISNLCSYRVLYLCHSMKPFYVLNLVCLWFMSHKLSKWRVALFIFVLPQIASCCLLQSGWTIMVDIVYTHLYFCLLNIIKSNMVTHQSFSILSQKDSLLKVFSSLPSSITKANNV